MTMFPARLFILRATYIYFIRQCYINIYFHSAITIIIFFMGQDILFKLTLDILFIFATCKLKSGNPLPEYQMVVP